MSKDWYVGKSGKEIRDQARNDCENGEYKPPPEPVVRWGGKADEQIDDYKSEWDKHYKNK